MAEEPIKKKRFFLKHRKSSALVVSIILHGGFIAMAVVFVAVQAIQREDPTFEAKEVPRQKMKLRKLQVPVKDSKKSQAPKLRKTLVSKPKTTVSIKMPEIVGVPGGIGYGSGTGLGGGVGFGTMDLFGGSRGSGNELIGTLYDLKLTEERERVPMNDQLYLEEIEQFCGSWNPARFKKYFKAPKQKYATALYFPKMNADEAPKAFGVADIVRPRYWMIHYQGTIAAAETGQYRFWGYGDDVLIVRMRRREVLQANWNDRKAISWDSDDDMNQQYKIFGGSPLFIGDWFDLRKGEQVPVDIVLGECGGGEFAGTLLIQKRDETYQERGSGGPILPLFKMAELPDELLSQMKVNTREVTTQGPVFGARINAQ